MDPVNLIFKVLSNEATPEEVMTLEKWVQADRSNRNDYEDLKLLWQSAEMAKKAKQEGRKDEGFPKLMASIKRRQQRKRIVYKLLTLLLFLITGLVIFLFFQ